MYSNLKKFFSVPNYISMNSSGIEVGNNFVRFVEFTNLKGVVKLSNFGEFPLAPKTFKDGEIINKEELIKTLYNVKKSLKNDYVKVSVPEEKTYLFNVNLPYIKPSEIRQALEFKLEENVPLKLSESIFEFKLIKKPKNERENLFLNVSVIPQKTIEDYLEVFNIVGLNVISFETESKMVSKSLIPRHDNKTSMIVHIKDDSTTMSIVSQGVTCFTSSVPVGNNSVLDSFKRVSGGKYENIKKIPDKILSRDESYDENVYDSFLNIFSVIKDEMEKFNRYWESQVALYPDSGFSKLDKVILCGRSAAIPGFVNHIIQNIGVDTVIGNVWGNTFNLDGFLPDLEFFDSLDYAVSIGLAMPSKNNSNIDND